jgi:hypothetical protein
MKLPEEYIDMLQKHCDKLEELGFHLFDLWSNTENPDVKVAELWFQAEQQLRLAAIELMLNQSAKPSEPQKTLGNVATRQARRVISNQPAQASGSILAGHESESCRC